MPIEERFWSKVWKRRSNFCWHWTGATNVFGHGCFRVSGKTVLAHRVAFELTHKRRLTSEEAVCHACDTPSCVNPDHLWLGTVADNNADRHKKGRSSGGSQSGMRNPMSRLTDDDVMEIAASTGDLKEIAKKYGIPFQSVSAIRRGRAWASVTGRRFTQWRIDGLGPQEYQVLEYIKLRSVDGAARISDTRMAVDLGFPSRMTAAFAKRRLSRLGRIKKIKRSVWAICAGGHNAPAIIN